MGHFVAEKYVLQTLFISMKSVCRQLILLIEWSISVSGLTWEGKEKVDNKTESRTEIRKHINIWLPQHVVIACFDNYIVEKICNKINKLHIYITSYKGYYVNLLTCITNRLKVPPLIKNQWRLSTSLSLMCL